MNKNSVSIKNKQIEAVDKHELIKALYGEFMRYGIPVGERVIYFPDEERPVLWIEENRKGEIKDIRCPKSKLTEAQNTLQVALNKLNNRTPKLSYSYLFSTTKMPGPYRYKDIFQIYPTGDRFYEKTDLMSGINWPHVIEYKYNGSPDLNLSSYTQTQTLQKIITALNGILRDPFLPLSNSYQRTWVVNESKSPTEIDLFQIGFSDDVDRNQQTDFSTQPGEPSFLSDNEYYNRSSRLITENHTDLPERLTLYLDKYFSLGANEYARFEACFRWLQLEHVFWRYSKTMAFCALINALEALQRGGSNDVKPGSIKYHFQCILEIAMGKTIKGPTKQFEEFVGQYLPDDQEMIKEVKKFYNLRSSTYHGGHFFGDDNRGMMSDPQAVNEKWQHRDLQLTARLVAVNELLKSNG